MESLRKSEEIKGIRKEIKRILKESLRKPKEIKGILKEIKGNQRNP